jgi:integrase
MGKRQYGSGGVYRRGRVWWVKYYVDRYPVFESAKTRDKKRAEELLKQRLAEVELNQLPDPESRKIKIQDILNSLLSDYELRGRTSRKQLESRIKLHLGPLLGPIRAQDFGHRQVDAYVRQRRQQRASDATINRELEHLRAAFSLAVDNEVVPKAPKIRMLDEDNVRYGFLEHNQYEALRQALPAYLVPLFVTGYHVGCRLGELLKLGWEQVDFAASQIWLERAQTKGKVPRVLPIYGDMRTVLVSAFQERNERFPECQWIFHRDGNRIVDFRKAWARACVLAGVRGLRFHDLRRSAVRNMDRAGIPRATIRRIIGHETEAMFNRYRIVDQRDIGEAGKKAEQYLKEQASGPTPPKESAN